jgi:hypothetical protein
MAIVVKKKAVVGDPSTFQTKEQGQAMMASERLANDPTKSSQIPQPLRPPTPMNLPFSPSAGDTKDKAGRIFDKEGNIKFNPIGEEQAALEIQKQKAAGIMTTEEKTQNIQAKKAQQEAAQAAGQQVGQLTAEQQALDVVEPNIFEKGKIAAGIGTAAGGAFVGAGTGAGATTAATIAGATGATAGAVIGATVGVAAVIGGVGAYTFLERQDAKKAGSIYSDSVSTMNKIIQGINTGTIPPSEYGLAVESFNQQKANILSAQRNLKAQTNSDLKKFLSGADGKAFEVNNYVDNVLPYQQAKLISALMTPNPSNIVSDMTPQ